MPALAGTPARGQYPAAPHPPPPPRASRAPLARASASHVEAEVVFELRSPSQQTGMPGLWPHRFGRCRHGRCLAGKRSENCLSPRAARASFFASRPGIVHAGNPRQGAASAVRPKPRHTRPPHQKDTTFPNPPSAQASMKMRANERQTRERQAECLPDFYVFRNRGAMPCEHPAGCRSSEPVPKSQVIDLSWNRRLSRAWHIFCYGNHRHAGFALE
jgi:hypothetical protein